MPLFIDFKNALIKALDEYVKHEQSLTVADSALIVNLKKLINEQKNAIHLYEEISSQLHHIPRKFFSFLPFVNDLHRELQSVLEQKRFNQHALLFSSYGDLVLENQRLQSENQLLRREFEEFKKSGLEVEIARTIQKIQDENSELHQKLSQQKEQHAQEINVLKMEKEMIVGSLGSLMSDKETLLKENGSLKIENEQLKKELEAYKKTSNSESKSTPRPNQFF